jgi:hypothetical protein
MEYIDLTELLIAVITVLVGIAARYAIPYLKEKWGNEKLENIRKWVKIAVNAAEMIYTESGMGEKKKAYVLEYLHNKGFDLDLDTLNNFIESAVLELKREY